MQRAARFVISLDLELFWGMRHRHSLEVASKALRGVRRVVPALLHLFAEYDVRATWAGVGFLFCETKDELLEHLPRRLPAYHDLKLSPYAHIAQIGEDEGEDPYHFAPSLIRQIKAVPGQEIASKTFSHYHCMEEGQDLRDFEADLEAAIAIARRRGIILRSLVFPRGQFRNDYLVACRRLGISSFRGSPPIWPYDLGGEESIRGLRRVAQAVDSVLPVVGEQCVSPGIVLDRKPVNIPASRQLRPFAGPYPFFARMQRWRIFRELDYAARTGGVYHLWWPLHSFGLDLRPKLEELRRILDRVAGWRRLGRMESVTMHEIVLGSSKIEGREQRPEVGGRAF